MVDEIPIGGEFFLTFLLACGRRKEEEEDKRLITRRLHESDESSRI